MKTACCGEEGFVKKVISPEFRNKGGGVFKEIIFKINHCSFCKKPAFLRGEEDEINRKRKIRYEEMDGLRPVGKDDGILRAFELFEIHKSRK